MIDTSLLGNLEINRTIQKSVTGRMSKIDNLFSEMRLVVELDSPNGSTAKKKTKKKRVKKLKSPRIIPVNNHSSRIASREKVTVAEAQSPLKFLLNNINTVNEFVQTLGMDATSLAKFMLAILLLILAKSRITAKL